MRTDPAASEVVTVVEFRSLLADSRAVLSEHPALALVPLATSMLSVGNVQRVVAFDGGHAGLKFTTPAPILDLWSFVSLPGAGVHGPAAGPLAVLPVLAVVHGLLAAGYLGAVHDALTGREVVFRDDVRAHAVPMVGFTLLQLGVALVVVPLATMSPAVLIPATLALVAFGYLFYGTPYLVVADDAGLVGALRRSGALATGSRDYAVWFLAVLVGGTAVSIPATVVVVNAGIAGVLLGAVLAAPLAVVGNAATMALFADVEPDSAASRERSGGHGAEGR